MTHTKLISIGVLPLMWTIYFLFELITGRVTSISSITFNCFLILLFSIVGYFLYTLSQKYVEGLPRKNIITIFIISIIIDQGIKIIIKYLYFNTHIVFINDILSFSPIINSEGSWLNARFNTSISFTLLIIINSIALLLLYELFRYFLHKGHKSFWGDIAFLFLFTGALCSLIDKVFYGGSLDFIGICNLFIADIKDIYINLGLYAFIICTYNSGYLTSEDNSTLKDDLDSIKSFLTFMKNDLFSKIKK